MAYWGIAMTFYHPLWAAPNPQEFAAGAAAAQKAAQLAPNSSQVAPAGLRERGYIDAMGRSRDADRPGQGSPGAVEREITSSPTKADDHEAQIFYALSLLGARAARRHDVRESEEGRRDPERAAAARATTSRTRALPDPLRSTLRARAAELPAAHAYAKIAPVAPHALHMPSHIFTRLGLWNDSIASNLAAAAAARTASRSDTPAPRRWMHYALDYLEYAYLQIGDEASARQVLAEAATAKTFDEAAFQAGYALAAIPARYALERRDWGAAAQLEPSNAALPWERFVYANATTYFAQAIGAARSGQLDRARAALRRLRHDPRRTAEDACSRAL